MDDIISSKFEAFVSALSKLKLDSTFNPYSDRCAVHDRFDAHQIRRKNLLHMLEGAMRAEAKSIWIARDLGYRGGRRTGIPLTDEANLASASAMFGAGPLQRATVGPPISERTASVVWRAIRDLDHFIVPWNIFPLHPYKKGDPLSNRCHTRAERRVAWPLLQDIIELVQPQYIVAIGRDAQAALEDFGSPIQSVRHPSYGGQKEFLEGIARLYRAANED